MINTFKEFQTVLDEITTRLRIVRNEGLLNDEGNRTLEACDRLSELVEFHNDFSDYMEDDDVNDILENFSDCKKINSIERFLNKKIKE